MAGWLRRALGERDPDPDESEGVTDFETHPWTDYDDSGSANHPDASQQSSWADFDIPGYAKHALPRDPAAWPPSRLNPAQLEVTAENVRKSVGPGVLGVYVWQPGSGRLLISLDEAPPVVDALARITDHMRRALAEVGVALNRYYVVDLTDGQVAIVQSHGGDAQSAIIIDGSRANLGLLISVAVPEMAQGVQAATRW